MKIAIIHDWLTGMRGGEKCLEILSELYPDADLYTLIHVRGSVSGIIERMNIKPSFLQMLPFNKKYYRHLLPLMPKAIESFDLSGYDLVISSSHCVAKGVITNPETCHICYCHTPMRYVWDQYENYFKDVNPIKKIFISKVMSFIRDWDRTTADRVNYYIANSKNISLKIKSYYNRTADVIYPPVDTYRYNPEPRDRYGYLIVSAFAPYKRLDIAIEAFNELGYPLKIVGKGQEEARLKSIAKSNIEFCGWVGDDLLKDYYAGCSALVFPGEEDFGIVPLEAQASGSPVIAFAKGGALETIVPANDGKNEIRDATGLFFFDQTPEALIEAVKYFESIKNKFDCNSIRTNALRFDRAVFKKQISAFVTKKYREYQGSSLN